MTTYRITDIKTHFGHSDQAKTRGPLPWVKCPTKHDGKGFRRIAAHPDGVRIFSGWILILQEAAKMPIHGILADEHGPLTAEDLSIATGFPQDIFEIAIKVLSDPKIGWITADVSGITPEPVRTQSDSVLTRVEESRREENIPPTPKGVQTDAPEGTLPPSGVDAQDYQQPDGEMRDAIAAVDRWSECQRGYPMRPNQNENRQMQAKLDALRDGVKIRQGQHQQTKLAMVPAAVEILMKKETPFRGVKYAFTCLCSTLDEWAVKGIPGTHAQAPPISQTTLTKFGMKVSGDRVTLLPHEVPLYEQWLKAHGKQPQHANPG